ncbi:MAG: IS1096 element passenger TnpR family protein [Streptosporangiaceae bacterium]
MTSTWPRLPWSFDWHGYRLHAFETVCGEFGSPDDDDDWSDRKDETTAALAQVAAAEKAKVVYAYDFGDDWRSRSSDA